MEQSLSQLLAATASFVAGHFVLSSVPVRNLIIERVGALLKRASGRIHHRRLDRISPLAVPVLLEIGREQVYGGAMDRLLYEASESLIAEAMPELAARSKPQPALPL